MSFTPDNIVHTLAGDRFLADLSEETDPIAVLTWDGARVTVGYIKVHDPKITIATSVELDDGEVIQASPETEVFVLDGFRVPFRDLIEDTRLLPIYLRRNKKGFPTYREPGQWHKTALTITDQQRTRNLNRVTAEFLLKRRLQHGDIITHIDGEKLNCDPKNIRIDHKEPTPTSRKNPMVEAIRTATEELEVLGSNNHRVVAIEPAVSGDLFSISGIGSDNLAMNGIFVGTDSVE